MRLDIIPVLKAHPTILLLSVSTALLTSGQGMVAPILPLYADELGVSTPTIGLVISAFGLARLMTNMPTAILTAPPFIGLAADMYGATSALVANGVVAALMGVVFLLFAGESVVLPFSAKGVPHDPKRP